jgi:hypothetical protein
MAGSSKRDLDGFARFARAHGSFRACPASALTTVSVSRLWTFASITPGMSRERQGEGRRALIIASVRIAELAGGALARRAYLARRG